MNTTVNKQTQSVVKDTTMNKPAEPVNIARVLNHIRLDFAKIGMSNGTKMPASDNNGDPVAWDIFVAQELTRLAKARLDEAMARGVASGIIFDHKENPRKPGVNELLFSGKVCAISVVTKQPATKFDWKRFVNRIKTMFPDKKKEVEDVEAMCMDTNATPHTFTAQLVYKE